MSASPTIPVLRSLDDAAGCDALVLVGPAPWGAVSLSPAVRGALEARLAIEPAPPRGQTAMAACGDAPGGRMVLAPTGPLSHFTDDVRRYAEAAVLGVRRAVRAGAKRPALYVDVCAEPRFARALVVAAAAAADVAWVHPQWGSASELAEIGVAAADPELLARAAALEAGRWMARDLTAGDPEFHAPEGFAARCEAEFSGSAVQVSVERDAAAISREYPLLGAVARASLAVPRHHPRIVRLHYDGGSGTHFCFAGKGVTYDTGGADLKVGGAMRGMSGDKGGAAGVAGFFRLLAAAQPPGLRATALLGCVRNSIGADAYVSDEVIRSRAGVHVVVGNTDAEGRMVLADLLAEFREGLEDGGPSVLCSVATLTGHVIRAYGHYGSVMGNDAALAAGWPQRLVDAGDALGDPFEHSRIRREDYEMIAPRADGGPTVQCNSAPSSATPRGHQFPFAFLERASGLDRHQLGTTVPTPFLHLDIAGAAEHGGGPQAGEPTGAPVPALAGALLEWA